jgi:predicted nucleic acid-binding protein
LESKRVPKKLAAAPLSAIDTGVFIEYMDELGDFHSQATAVVESITSGSLVAVIPHPVFAELYYVSNRIFDKVGAKDADLKASNLVTWLYRSPNVFVPESTVELALEAGRIKRKFNFALPDSYVLASAKLNRCDAVFKSQEAEMKKRRRLLAHLKSEIKGNLIFLEDYA